MRTITLKEVKKKVNNNEYLIDSINKLVESTPAYSSERKRPKNEVEFKILKKFKPR